jgi:hypothetical protein
MHRPYDLKLLFATTFTDGCFRAIRALAQMADAMPVSLTIAHVSSSGQSLHGELQSFFAEADHYPNCNRVQLQGTSPAKALAAYAHQERHDLILVPRSDRLGFPRPFHRSTRSELLRSGVAPLWTGNRGLDRADFLRPYRVIAVGMDGTSKDVRHLELAASFAANIGARLHLLTVVPPIHEGTLLDQTTTSEPLSEKVASRRIEKLLAGWNRIPTIDVAIGSFERELPRMLRRCEADLLFLSESQSCSGLFFPQISRAVDQSPCSVISVPTNLRYNFTWSFESAAAEELLYSQEARNRSHGAVETVAN